MEASDTATAAGGEGTAAAAPPVHPAARPAGRHRLLLPRPPSCSHSCPHPRHRNLRVGRVDARTTTRGASTGSTALRSSHRPDQGRLSVGRAGLQGCRKGTAFCQRTRAGVLAGVPHRRQRHLRRRTWTVWAPGLPAARLAQGLLRSFRRRCQGVGRAQQQPVRLTRRHAHLAKMRAPCQANTPRSRGTVHRQLHPLPSLQQTSESCVGAVHPGRSATSKNFGTLRRSHPSATASSLSRFPAPRA